MNDYKTYMLRMEDVLEERLEIDQRATAEIDTDLSDIIEGQCDVCDRLYYNDYLTSITATKDACVPCWRKENGYPKLEPGV